MFTVRSIIGIDTPLLIKHEGLYISPNNAALVRSLSHAATAEGDPRRQKRESSSAS